MKDINETQLAYLLNVSKKEAIRKIAYCKGKRHKDKEEVDEIKSIKISVSEFEEKSNINIQFAIDNLQQKAMKPGAFRGFLVNYPIKKLKPSKSGFYPKIIRLPTALRSLMTKEHLQELKNEWATKYFIYNRDFGTVFNP